jgi:hypothetical protein
MAFPADPDKDAGQTILGGARMSELQVFDSTAMPWEERFVPELGKALFAKRFLEDPETGVTVRLVKYPAGFMSAWYTHHRIIISSR